MVYNSINMLPDWLSSNDEYNAPSDRDGFLTRSMLSLMSMLASFRAKTTSYGAKYPAPLKLVVCLAMILITSLARNMLIAYVILAILLAHICFLRSDLLVRTITTAFVAAGISMLILLPAVFLGSPQSMLTVSIKVFTSVGLIGLLASTTEWNKLTAGLAAFHIPDVFIFTLDITLKYIVILGNISMDMLNALQLRSIGYNHSKAQSLSGVLGVTFLKSRQISEEMFQAMQCRGFEGEYRRTNND